MYLMAIGLTSLCLMGFAFYMFYIAHHDVIDVRTIGDPLLPEAFNGLTIFFISDIHRRSLNIKTMNKLSSMQVDLVIIGGDLREKGVPFSRTKANLQLLKQWQAPIYFVWGNNDYESDYLVLQDLLEKESIHILANSNDIIERQNETIQFVGLDCNEYREARLDLAAPNMMEDYSILITHNPTILDTLDSTRMSKVNLVLGGHTHGGQIRFGPLGYYTNGGLKHVGTSTVFISEGYGYTLLPFRLGTKAECHLLTLTNQAQPRLNDVQQI